MPFRKFNHHRLIRGFSLIELAVAFGVLSVLMLVAVRVYKGSRASSVIAQRNAKTQETLDRIASDLKRTNYYFIANATNKNKSGVHYTSGNSYSYYVAWDQSKMKTALEAYEQWTQESNFDNFTIKVVPHYRRDAFAVNAASVSLASLKNAWVPFGDLYNTDTDVRFIDRNGDGDYFDVIYDSAKQRWVSEIPEGELKVVTISLDRTATPNPSVNTERSVILYRNDMETRSLKEIQKNVPIFIDWPNNASRFYKRDSPEKRASLDLPVRFSLPAGRWGLPSGREYRFDTYTDPTLGVGLPVCHGQSTKGAVVRVKYYAYYTLSGSGTGFYTPGSGTSRDLTVTNTNGEFLFYFDNSFTTMMLNECATIKPGKSSYYVYLLLSATYNGNSSQTQQIDFELCKEAAVPTIETRFPTDTVKSLIPGIGTTPGTGNSEFLKGVGFLNGVRYNISNGLYSDHFGIFIDPTTLLPPLLSDNTNYTAEFEGLYSPVFKASTTWSFNVDLGIAGPGDDDPTPPILSDKSTSFFAGGMGAGLSFTITDPESGVDYRTLSVKVDGVEVVPTIEAVLKHYSMAGPDGIFYYYPLGSETFSVGAHTVRVRASHFSNTPSDAASRTVDETWTMLVK